MLAAYAAWSVVVCLSAGLGTWAALAVWRRSIRREERDVLRVLREREAAARARADAEVRAAQAVAASERRHRALTMAGASAVWQADADGRITAMEGWAGFAGTTGASQLGGRGSWLDAVAPEDHARAAAAWCEALAAGTPLDAEFRMALGGGADRWCRARAVPVGPPESGPGEWIGVIEDVDDRRRAEEARMLLAQEVNHRAKNMLAVVQAVVGMTRAPTPAEYAAAVSARVAALGRAHDLLADRDWSEVGLHELAEGELAGYSGDGARSGDGMASGRRIRVEGPRIRLAPRAVQPIAMVLHELAVNAAKHGALSAAGGTVTLRWSVAAEALRLTWEERGGPPIVQEPGRQGFGTRVIDATVREQLGGQIERGWSAHGLDCDLLLPLGNLGTAAVATQPAVAVPGLTRLV